MNHLDSADRARRIAAGIATVIAPILLIAASILPEGSVQAAPAGAVQVLTATAPAQPVTNGSTSTAFSLTPPAGSACSGIAANNFRWSTYMVSSAVDAATLTFTQNGPNAVAGQQVFSLFDVDQNTVAAKNPSQSPAGQVSGIPTFSFAALQGTTVPNGTYKIGIACTLSDAVEGGHYWEALITISQSTAQGFTWVGPGSESSTSSSSTSTTSTTTTTTTLPGSTTTTSTLRTTTTTTSPGSTTSTVVGSSTVTTVGSGGRLVETGSSPVPIAVWAVLLLALGRMAILFARPVRVLPPGRS